MENFDRENIDELLEIRQIRQYFPPSKICAVRHVLHHQLACEKDKILVLIEYIQYRLKMHL